MNEIIMTILALVATFVTGYYWTAILWPFFKFELEEIQPNNKEQ